MSDVIIQVENLGKKYRIRHQRKAGHSYVALRDVLAEKARGFFRRCSPLRLDRGEGQGEVSNPTATAPTAEDFWALKGVSFEVKRGEVIGIIGRNGAGKSTLLKILSRITDPTEGRVRLRGRVGSLLEVGTGFHPELTGRENIFLNGAVLGMTRAEIKRKFNKIVAFAEVKKFLDTPVKHYSSGMRVRLAFAVAAHLEPEILVVDEVLAVGDMEFQDKCMGKMREVSQGGRTVLLVSHNMGAISALCNKALLLERGAVVMFGDTESVIQHYASKGEKTTEWTGDAGNQQLRLKHSWVRSLDPRGRFHTASDVEIGAEVEILQRTNNLVLGFNLYSEFGQPLAFCLYDDQKTDPPPAIEPGKLTHRFVIPANSLAHGTYHVRFDIGIFMVERIIDQQGMLSFHMENVCGLGRRFIVPNSPQFLSLFRPPWAR